MKKSILILSFLMAVPTARGDLPEILMMKFKQGRELMKDNPEKACQVLQPLAGNPSFILQDLAFLDQSVVCEDPIKDPPYTISLKPWLIQRDLERKLRESLRRKDLQAAVEIKAELAKSERTQKAILKMLAETEEFVNNFDAPELNKKLAVVSIRRFREAVAPRLMSKPGLQHQVKIAQDHLVAREFEPARAWAKKVLARKSSVDDKIAARRIIRTSFKLEGKTESFLQALAGDWAWASKSVPAPKAIEIGLLYARAMWTEGRMREAREILNKVEARFPRHPALNDIHFVRGKMAEEEKDWAAALAQYEKARLGELKTPLEKKIQFAKAWVAWKSKMFEQSATALDPLIALGQDDPFESARALFWKARVMKQLGKTEESAKLLKDLRLSDPVGFYGVIAHAEQKEKFPALKVPLAPTEFPKSTLYDASYFQALAEVGERELLQKAAKAHVEAVRPQEKVENWLPLFLAAAKANSYLPLFSQIPKLDPANRSVLLEKDPELLFPLDFKDRVLESSAKFGVSPELILSVIRQESAFDPYARSHADALGLMQLLPGVAKVYGKEVGIEIGHFEDLYKPEVNIPYGTILLRDLMKRHDQKIFLAAAAYNANEKALKKWLKMRWNGDVIEFIEEIPYEETRAYVKLIIRNCAFYSRLLKSGESIPFPTTCLGG